MDTRTGELLTEEEMKLRMKQYDRMFSDFVPVQEEEMTPKQKVISKVSLKDHKSILGKKLTAARFQRNYSFRKRSR